MLAVVVAAMTGPRLWSTHSLLRPVNEVILGWFWWGSWGIRGVSCTASQMSQLCSVGRGHGCGSRAGAVLCVLCQPHHTHTQKNVFVPVVCLNSDNSNWNCLSTCVRPTPLICLVMLAVSPAHLNLCPLDAACGRGRHAARTAGDFI